jgi:hypothetical protein
VRKCIPACVRVYVYVGTCECVYMIVHQGEIVGACRGHACAFVGVLMSAYVHW